VPAVVALVIEHGDVYVRPPRPRRLLPPADRTFVPPAPDVELQRHLRLTSPRPARLRFGYVDFWDYPNGALAREDQGTAVIRVVVGPVGRIERCEVIASSGSFALDAASCAIPTRRFVYLPALGRGGRPVRETRSHRIVWRIPEDRWPTLIEVTPEPNFLQDEPPPA
jgi:TonB family protein